jgi:phosphotriesterase-related protein
VIGELGCQEPLHPEEARVLAAGAKAQARTGAGLTIHTPIHDRMNKRPPKQGKQEVEILQKYGCDLSKVYLSHMDFTWEDSKYQQDLMDDFGITLSYDCFGQEQYYDNIYFGAGGVTDRERCRAIANHIKNGYAKQLVISGDTCEKIHLRKYGGYGYSNVLEHVVPFLELLGVSEKQVRTMMVDNPKRVLQK